MPKSFTKLSDEFFSLGQSESYYINLQKIDKYVDLDVLNSLNDMAKNINILEENNDKNIIRTSILRSISRSSVRGQLHRIANGGVALTPYDFSYVFHQDSLAEESKLNHLSFNVEVDSLPPTNLHVLIGRNSVGKTRLLNNMVDAFLHADKNKEGYFESDDEIIDNPYTIFPNLIYMSYSAFDDTIYTENQIDKSSDRNYIYLGLRKKVNVKDNKDVYATKSLDELTEEFGESLKQCKASKDKTERLKDSIKILESDPIFKAADFTSLLDDVESLELPNIYSLFERLSTGHRVILITITKLVETVEEKSLILLDEPETHLHPPLLSSFIRCLSSLAVDRNAVAIIATHSPVILQEVPRNCVWKLRRSGSICGISRPKIETFGESYSKLVEDVFALEIDKSGFHTLIAEQVKNAQILMIFMKSLIINGPRCRNNKRTLFRMKILLRMSTMKIEPDFFIS